MTISVQNFGCRLNALDGDKIQHASTQAGLKNATIINSCAVTSEAVRQARQAVRKAHKDNPEQKIYLTGCAAQSDSESFKDMPELTALLGNEDKFTPSAYTDNSAVSDIMQEVKTRPMPVLKQKRARALVQIQTGCDHRCTFCIIPYGRGNSRSTPIAEVIKHCQSLIEQGHKEIVLTGVDITSWGADIGEEGLSVLIRAILKSCPDLPRLRLSSVDAVELDAGLLDMVIHESRLMPYLHLSLQSGDDMILKRMKRRHSRQQAIEFCQTLKERRPDLVYGADIIAGFPTETDAMFENSNRLIEECGLVWLHIFPYSKRPNTPAALMPQIDGNIIKERAKILRETGDKIRHKWLDTQIGTQASIVIETPNIGRCENFAQVMIETPRTQNELVTAQITRHDGKNLYGDII